MDNVIFSDASIPYWVLALITIFDIVVIIFDKNIKTHRDIEHRLNRIRLSVIPKLILFVIYTWFAFDPNISIQMRSLYGRNSIFIMLLFDFFIHFNNIVDSNKDIIKIKLKNLLTKIKGKMKNNKKI